MLVALETGLQISEADELAWKQGRFDNIVSVLGDIPGVSAKTFIATGHAKEMYLDIDWDTDVVRLSRDDFVQALRDNDPSVEVRLFRFSGGRIHLSATVMNDGEDVIVGQVIRKVLLAHS